MTDLSFVSCQPRFLTYPHYQLQEHLKKEDNEKQTLLQLAALSGNKDTVDAVWDACRELGIKATEVPVVS